jgi:hypothetical protein
LRAAIYHDRNAPAQSAIGIIICFAFNDLRGDGGGRND